MKEKRYIKSFFIKVLICIVLFLITSIFVNYSDANLLLFKNHVYDKSFNFSKITNIYNKYFGKVLPADEKIINASHNTNYSNYNTYKDGAVINDITTVYPFKSGIVVFIGDKEEYGQTIIIQGMDGIDYWYSNVENINVKLYDYIESDNIIATAKDNKLYVLFMKDGKFLNYEEYI